MFITRHKTLFFSISGALVALAIASIAAFGLNFGIDFTGGTLVEISYEEEIPHDTIAAAAEGAIPEKFSSAQPIDETDYLIRTKFLSSGEREALTTALLEIGDAASIERVSSVGPTIGEELKSKAVIAIALVLAAIILFVAFTFRKVSEPVSSWMYGSVAILALVHDILIPTGIFALLGYLYGVEIDILFVTAMLAILGFSVNDTIVVFDRIRENLKNRKEKKKKSKESFAELVGRSLDETFVRSFNTSFAALLVIGSLYFLGGDTTKYFALALGLGTIFGAYSSLFIASPLLITIERWQGARTKRK